MSEPYPADYEWIITDDLMGMKLSEPTADNLKVLVASFETWKSAILVMEDRKVMTNGKYIDYGDEFPVILGILDYMDDTQTMEWHSMPLEDTTEEGLARWAATQPQDNIVHLMSCGHQYDSPQALEYGTKVTCSQHGETTIVGEFAGPKEAKQ